MKKRLLIISCGKAKNQSDKSMPALHLYDGPIFKMIRALQRNKKWPEDTRLLILSAKFGLIEPERVISSYDDLMTPVKARALKKQVERKIDEIISQYKPDEIFCNLGQKYWDCLKDSVAGLSMPVASAEGRIGEKLSKTKNWLLKISNH